MALISGTSPALLRHLKREECFGHLCVRTVKVSGRRVAEALPDRPSRTRAVVVPFRVLPFPELVPDVGVYDEDGPTVGSGSGTRTASRVLRRMRV